MHKLFSKIRKEVGFTLLDLLVVLVIIGGGALGLYVLAHFIQKYW